MNITRLIKLKLLNSELDDFTDKEIFLLGYFDDLNVVCEGFPSKSNTGETLYYLSFIDKKDDDIIFCSNSRRMFKYIIPHIYYEYDKKFYRSKLCGIDYKFENEMFSFYYDSDIYHEVIRIYTNLDKKLKISKNAFKHYGLGH